MENQINQQFTFNTKKKAIISLVLGLIGSIPIMTLVTLVDFLHFIPPMVYAPILNIIFFPILPLISIIGLIFGKIGLKSTKKFFAIAGIVLNMIGLMLPLYYFLFQ